MARSTPTISNIDAWAVDVPLADDFVISRGRVSVARNAFVRVRLSDGSAGFGEMAPFEALTGETREGELAAVDELAPAVIGRPVGDPVAVAEALSASGPGHVAARAALECAAADANARSLGEPLWRIWGAGAVAAYRTDITLPILDDTRVLELATQWHARGFRTFKLKVGIDVSADCARVEQLARAFDDVDFILDANQGYDASSAIAFLDGLRALERRVALIEQPVARGDLAAMADLRGRGFRIAADESVFTLADAQRVIDSAAADVINLKIGKTGLAETMAVADAARSAGLGLMVGGMVETRLAMSFSLALALGRGGVTWFDLDTPLLMSHDPLDGGYQYEGDRMSVWQTPGVGMTPAGECRQNG